MAVGFVIVFKPNPLVTYWFLPLLHDPIGWAQDKCQLLCGNKVSSSTVTASLLTQAVAFWLGNLMINVSKCSDVKPRYVR